MEHEILERLKDNLSHSDTFLGKDKYLNSAVLISLVYINDELHFLFQKRAPHIRQGGEICFPGGKYDPAADMDFEGTAVRETIEELGITADQIEVLGHLGIMVAPMGVTVDAYIALLHVDVAKIEFNTHEVESIFTMPLSFFLNHPPEVHHVRIEVQPHYDDDNGNRVVLLPSEELGLPELYANPWGKMKFPIYLYQTEQGPLWGLTSELVFEMLKLS